MVDISRPETSDSVRKEKRWRVGHPGSPSNMVRGKNGCWKKSEELMKRVATSRRKVNVNEVVLDTSNTYGGTK